MSEVGGVVGRLFDFGLLLRERGITACMFAGLG